MTAKGNKRDVPLKPGQPIFDFYEKLHFHELDEREKLNGKFQLFVTTAAAILGYLMSLINKAAPTCLCDLPLFATLGIFALLIICVSGFFFIRSYTLSSAYSFFPKSKEAEDYRQSLAQYDEENNLKITETNFFKFMLNTLITVSTKNAEMNEIRFKRVRTGNALLVAAIVVTLLASAAYWFSDVKKNDANLSIVIAKPVKIESNVMAQTPSPPPPQPERTIKDQPQKPLPKNKE